MSEKRYFKLAIGKSSKEDAVYLALFNAIDKQKEYDGKKILNKVKTIKPNQLANLKHYLYIQILTSLGNFHAGSSIEMELSALLRNMEVLYLKGFYKQCWKILEKAKKIAELHEKFLITLDILTWEHKLLGKETDYEKIKKYIEESKAQESKVIEKWVNHRDYKRLAKKLQLIYTIDPSLQNKKIKKEAEFFFNDPLLQREETALSYYAKGDYYHFRSMYFHLVKKDPENAFIYTKKRIQLYESHAEMKKEDFEYHIDNMGNYITWCILLGHKEEGLNYLKELNEILYDKKLNGSQNLREKIFKSYYLNIYTLYNASGEFEKGIALIPKMESFIKEFDLNIPKFFEITLHYYSASLYFGAAQYDKALNYLNKLTIYKEKEDNALRKDIHCASRLLELMIHYELKNDHLLEYKLLSAYRYLPKEKMLYKTEKIMLNFIKLLPKAETKKDLLNLFTNSEKEIATILQEKDPEELNVLDYLDIRSWLLSKIEDRSFAEVVRRNNHFSKLKS